MTCLSVWPEGSQPSPMVTQLNLVTSTFSCLGNNLNHDLKFFSAAFVVFKQLLQKVSDKTFFLAPKMADDYKSYPHMGMSVYDMFIQLTLGSPMTKDIVYHYTVDQATKIQVIMMLILQLAPIIV